MKINQNFITLDYTNEIIFFYFFVLITASAILEIQPSCELLVIIAFPLLSTISLKIFLSQVATTTSLKNFDFKHYINISYK